MTTQQPGTQVLQASKHTLRLTLEYERQDVRLVAGQRIAMIPPPGEARTIHQGQSGSWIELRDADEVILFQSVLHNPIRYTVEEPERGEFGRPRRHNIEHPRGTFQLLVPDLPNTQPLVLFNSPPGAPDEPALELARFRLDINELDRLVKP